jgi:hypothetical protein
MNLEERVERIESILRANQQHELHCPALITPESIAFFGMNLGRSLCDCWLAPIEPDPTKGFVAVSKEGVIMRQKLFTSRYEAVHYLCWGFGLSRDPQSEDYWGNRYHVTSGSYTPTKESAE